MKNGNYDIITLEYPMQRLHDRGTVPAKICKEYDLRDGDELQCLIGEVGKPQTQMVIKLTSGHEFLAEGLKNKNVAMTLFIPSGYEKTIGI